MSTIAVVIRELVVEVVVALTKGRQANEPGVLGCPLVGVGVLSPEVSKTVDAEGGLRDEHAAAYTGNQKAAEPVTPEGASNYLENIFWLNDKL